MVVEPTEKVGAGPEEGDEVGGMICVVLEAGNLGALKGRGGQGGS